jgi:transcriptional regulator with XRE-family HTH domain
MKVRKMIPTNDAPRQFMVDAMENIKTERKRRGIGQAELGSMVGLTQSQIALFERDPLSVKASRLYHLCAALGLEMIVRRPPAP